MVLHGLRLLQHGRCWERANEHSQTLLNSCSALLKSMCCAFPSLPFHHRHLSLTLCIVCPLTQGTGKLFAYVFAGISWILSLAMICICIIPLVFSLLSIFCGGASSCTYRLFFSELLAIHLTVLRFDLDCIFLLFCWLGKKKLILVSVFLAIWRPKKILNYSEMKKQGIY